MLPSQCKVGQSQLDMIAVAGGWPVACEGPGAASSKGKGIIHEVCAEVVDNVIREAVHQDAGHKESQDGYGKGRQGSFP